MTATSKRSPRFISALMLDPARLVERHEFYFRMLDMMAEWGFNTLWWHFVDDEGFVLKLKDHPEIATPYAFTKAETRRLIAEARQRGIDVVPEVESLGHASYITRLPQYAHLADGDPHHFNAICPSHRDTLGLLREIIEEVAELFDSQYFHAGLDEVDISGCRRCTRRAKGKPKWWLFAEHVKAIHKIVTGCGKRMIMWADHVHRAPAMLAVLPKDIVMCHWQYAAVDRAAIERSLDAGFEVIGAPSMLRHRDIIQPNARQVANTEEMITTIRKLRRRGAIGVANTWWTGRRILRDSALPLAAYTGHLLSGGTKDKAAFFTDYLRKQHGLRSKAAGDAMWTLHRLTLNLTEARALLFDSPADMADAIALAGGEDYAQRLDELNSAAETLSAAAGKVKRDREALAASTLAGRVAATLLQGGLDLRSAHDRYRQAENLRDRSYEPPAVAAHLEEALGLLAGIEGRLDRLCSQVSAEWDRTRHPGDAKKDTAKPALPCPMDSLMGRMVRSRVFIKKLTAGFSRAIKTYRRGGPFPTGV